MIRAGQLKDFVTVSKPSNSADSSGQRDGSFVRFSQAWAEVVQLSGKELIEARQLYSAVTTRVRMRFTDAKGINGSMRITVEGRILSIIAPPIDVDRKRQLVELLCQELV